MVSRKPLSKFGRRLTELCADRNVPKSALARIVSVSPSYMTNVVSDDGPRRHAPKPEYIETWCDALACTEDERGELLELAIEAKAKAQPGAIDYIEKLEQQIAAGEQLLAKALKESNDRQRELENFAALMRVLVVEVRKAGIELPQTALDAITALRL